MKALQEKSLETEEEECKLLKKCPKIKQLLSLIYNFHYSFCTLDLDHSRSQFFRLYCICCHGLLLQSLQLEYGNFRTFQRGWKSSSTWKQSLSSHQTHC